MNTKILCFSLLTITWATCKSNTSVDTAPPMLKTYFQNDFHIGSALGETHILQEDVFIANLDSDQFNTITPENIMKWENIHPEPKGNDFNFPDRFIQLGIDYDGSIKTIDPYLG